MKLLETYQITHSSDTAAQFYYKESNAPRDGGFVTGVSFFPNGTNPRNRNGWTCVAALVWTETPFTYSNEEMDELKRLYDAR